ncbi:acylphosphatase [Celerinatantimonas sp. YJH-8]|uniref:acylphosphatase n=1 Tax=Celerinatantimonas sp. YJH-8 TaxID=3228714 RepID=UPI0038C6FF72
MPVCKRAFVSGRVQGVGFRYFALMEARNLNLEGYARNLSDGQVEVVMKGSDVNVSKMLAWLRKGSPMARVERVVIESEFDWQGSGFSTN